jgi:two-component system, OmpR family, response regulator TrcR
MICMATKNIRVLLAEDDLQMGFIIKDSLEDEGYEVINCPDGETAWDQFQRKSPDICLLDINMPGRDGFSLAKKIRQRNDVVPILFLTAKSMEEDKLKGFESGADDFITKPFSMKELLSRMNVFLRRNKLLMPTEAPQYLIGKLQFFPLENRLLKGEQEIILTQKETRLLHFFCEHANKVLRREDILNHVWGKNDYFLGRSMDVYVAKLRKLLKTEESVVIETIPQAGYRMVLQQAIKK